MSYLGLQTRVLSKVGGKMKKIEWNKKNRRTLYSFILGLGCGTLSIGITGEVFMGLGLALTILATLELRNLDAVDISIIK